MLNICSSVQDHNQSLIHRGSGWTSQRANEFILKLKASEENASEENTPEATSSEAISSEASQQTLNLQKSCLTFKNLNPSPLRHIIHP